MTSAGELKSGGSPASVLTPLRIHISIHCEIL